MPWRLAQKSLLINRQLYGPGHCGPYVRYQPFRCVREGRSWPVTWIIGAGGNACSLAKRTPSFWLTRGSESLFVAARGRDQRPLHRTPIHSDRNWRSGGFRGSRLIGMGMEHSVAGEGRGPSGSLPPRSQQPAPHQPLNLGGATDSSSRKATLKTKRSGNSPSLFSNHSPTDFTIPDQRSISRCARSLPSN